MFEVPYLKLQHFFGGIIQCKLVGSSPQFLILKNLAHFPVMLMLLVQGPYVLGELLFRSISFTFDKLEN